MEQTALGGRRARILEILREADSPLSVVEIAEMIGAHINTARTHLESLVEIGSVVRVAEESGQPGRRRILYSCPAPGRVEHKTPWFRLLAQMLAGWAATKLPEIDTEIHDVGVQWGRYLTTRPAPFETFAQETIAERILDKLEVTTAIEAVAEPQRHLVIRDCPVPELVGGASGEIICQLHAGLISGSFAELGLASRVVGISPHAGTGICHVWVRRNVEVTVVPFVDPETGPEPLPEPVPAIDPQ
ncbi:MAG: helix-turn-helix domain-containing protein [Propionibacteriaceae bacterium]|jgi:predicted ArsR family transcriptional regulator|nr:helix-turn-helix domain-containing protein [Propionibacteriaceae bacterium]